jgi:hypothetical protein
MNSETFERLFTIAGRSALALATESLKGGGDVLRALVALERASVDAPLARAAVDIAQLRHKAAGKFPLAEEMFFTREALEQASDSACSSHRAIRFRDASLIADVGCGIGGDSIAFAAFRPLLALDRDRLRLHMARANLKVCQPEALAQFVEANWEDGPQMPLQLPSGAAVFCDPSRREEGRRVFSVHQYSPPLSKIDSWRARMPAIPFCIKASPGIRMDEIQGAGCEVEFLSVAGDLKEAILWHGAFRSAERRATRLPENVTMTESEPESDALTAPQEFLYEPDPSLLRAGLVRQLAAQLSAARIDSRIAYLTAPFSQSTPWARAYQLEEAMPFSLKRLREWLRVRGVGRVVIKKRGSPLVPEELELQLRLRGDAERVLFLTRVQEKPFVLIGSELKKQNS